MDFEQIEDKIITELKTRITYARTVETYAGQLEAKIEELPIQYPALYVTYAGSQFDWIDNEANYNEVAVFNILAANKNLKGQEAVRKDGAGGVYKLIKDVTKYITNQNFGLDIERMQLTEVQFVFTSQTITVYGIGFQTNFDTVYT
ncbi:MAG: DUF1834 family protein [Candidatus Jettenia sp.]|uniref:Phage protein n=1 Tax=Candidatus Jettenia caeni TaxID=247490 RepID=I3ILQ4_9BACT|nr:phage protein Gp37 [Candidatus Jettenia sp. AMX1]KAA0243565.1 MAG: DUF1834 family protein [Candidatus Brocadia sp. AMX2]MBC6930224.1 DUF1834 family protein [Candidatus Jettenia sp.]GAB62649.1 hypothetical protein KSU1_C1053 [Candidatus Jettenia caeni]MCQ3927097.1 DUF1834 family protein [Candidatus Jettenia sp.]MDL1939879.1 DUF1834 family protein [Candidatus Jettenia sp. AMX1]